MVISEMSADDPSYLFSGDGAASEAAPPLASFANKLEEAGDILKLNYFELLSPEPVQMPNVGGVISPTLREISSVGYNTYQYFLTILLMDLKTYLSMIGQPNALDSLPAHERDQISIFDLLVSHEQSCILLQNILNFFIKENVVFSPSHGGFVCQDGERPAGIVNKDNYADLCDIICQRNYIRFGSEDSLSKVTNKKAQDIIKKLRKGRARQSKQTKPDRNMELANIVSAIANKSHSLNIINIWDLTVYQVWDCFSRLSNNTIYDIQSMSVAAWGNKDNLFDASAWFQRMDTGTTAF